MSAENLASLRVLKSLVTQPKNFVNHSDEEIERLFRGNLLFLGGTPTNVPIDVRFGNVLMTLLEKHKDIDVRIIRILNQVDPNLKRYVGLSRESPLTEAVKNKNIEVVKLLLSTANDFHEGNFLAIDENIKNSPMMLLDDSPFGIELFELLYQFGNRDILRDDFYNPFCVAIDAGYRDLYMHILRRFPDACGRLCGERYCIIDELVCANRLDLIEECVKLGVSIADHKHTDKYCFHTAIQRDRYDIIIYLADLLGEDMGHRTDDGVTTLHVFARSHRFSLFERFYPFVQQYLQVTSKFNMMTPMNEALRCGRTKQANFLFERGALTDVVNWMGVSTVHQAALYPETHGMLVALKSQKSKWTANKSYGAEQYRPIHFAAAAGVVENVEYLGSMGVTICGKRNKANAKYSNGLPPIHCAAAYARIGASTTLLKYGADINELSEHGESLLVRVARGLRIENIVEPSLEDLVNYCEFLKNVGFRFEDVPMTKSFLNLRENRAELVRTFIRLGSPIEIFDGHIASYNFYHPDTGVIDIILTHMDRRDVPGRYSCSEEKIANSRYITYFSASLVQRLLACASNHVDPLLLTRQTTKTPRTRAPTKRLSPTSSSSSSSSRCIVLDDD